MTENKNFKRLVRARMEKTGESYTAARAHLVAKAQPPLSDDYEKLAGMSDAAVAKATGKSWPEWTEWLDGEEAWTWEHRRIADHVHDRHDQVNGWWAQMVTVGYERFRGLRDVGQRRGGDYDVNKSKTVAAPIGDLWHAFADSSTREKWLPGVELTIRTATEPKSMRIRLADDSPLDAYFTDKGGTKSAVSLQHRKLPDKETAAEMKAYWGERLDALKELLAE